MRPRPGVGILWIMRANGQGHDSQLRTDDAAELHDLEERLLSMFSTSVGSDEVRRCLASVFEHYNSAPIQTYVLLLTERRATRELRVMQQSADALEDGYRNGC
jgi:hypothetical protein